MDIGKRRKSYYSKEESHHPKQSVCLRLPLYVKSQANEKRGRERKRRKRKRKKKEKSAKGKENTIRGSQVGS